MGRGPVALRRRGFTLLAIAALTLVVDQLTKAAARAYLPPARSIPIIPGVLDLSYVRNTGAAFGMLAGFRVLFVFTTVAILAGIAYVWFHYMPRQWFVVVALGLVVGGALGNLVERVAVGRVTDFLYLHYWPVFNVADSAVVVGVSILVIWLLFQKDDDADEPEGPREA